MSNLIKIKSRDQFLSEIDTDKIVVVDFNATWCPPCRALAPIFSEIAAKHSDKVFLDVDIDLNQDLAKEYRILTIPTLFFFKNGELIKIHSQPADYKIIESILGKIDEL